MYLLNITKVKYPKNDTSIYEYETIDNLVMELKQFVLNNKINKDDIIRIEEDVKEDDFIDKQYEKMKKYIYNTSDEELEKHYQWYQEFDREHLLNSMFESYCCTYNDEELEKAIDKLLEEK